MLYLFDHFVSLLLAVDIHIEHYITNRMSNDPHIFVAV